MNIVICHFVLLQNMQKKWAYTLLILDATKNKRCFIACQVFILFYVLHTISFLRKKGFLLFVQILNMLTDWGQMEQKLWLIKKCLCLESLRSLKGIMKDIRMKGILENFALNLINFCLINLVQDQCTFLIQQSLYGCDKADRVKRRTNRI